MNPYFEEILHAHDLIKAWLGNPQAKEEVCDSLLARFSPDYSMVTLQGGLLNFSALADFFRAQRGARPGLEIEITALSLLAESAAGATVTYQELQHQPGKNSTLRVSTAVLEKRCDGQIIWRHLQETARPCP